MLSFRVVKLDIFQSYFFGEVEFRSDTYKVNIQNERRGKVLRLPFEIKPGNEKAIVRMTGPGDLFVEDYLPYAGRSEWLEIDSDEITYFLADNQDRLDTIEIVYGREDQARPGIDAVSDADRPHWTGADDGV